MRAAADDKAAPAAHEEVHLVCTEDGLLLGLGIPLAIAVRVLVQVLEFGAARTLGRDKAAGQARAGLGRNAVKPRVARDAHAVVRAAAALGQLIGVASKRLGAVGVLAAESGTKQKLLLG